MSESGAASPEETSADAAVLIAGAGLAAALAGAIFTVACGAGRDGGAISTLEVLFFASIEEAGLSAAGAATASLGAADTGLGGMAAPEAEATDGREAEGGLGAARADGTPGAGGLGAAGAGGLGTAAGPVPNGLGGRGAAVGAASAPGGFGMAGAGGVAVIPGLGMDGMANGLGGAGGMIPPGVAGVSAFGGEGMVGGAPVAVGRGFGGRLTIAASRGLAAPGFPSRRGGRTMRTVSFLGSFMAGFFSGRRRSTRLSSTKSSRINRHLEGVNYFAPDRRFFVLLPI